MKNILTITFTMLLTLSATAQNVSHNHDATKMNQIGLQETGAGTFTPAFYYDVFHNSYQKSALSTNKITYRSLASISSYNQVRPSEEIDSALTKRAKTEALNIADRTGGAVDLAWLAEGPKVEGVLEKFQRNINRIMLAGGSIDDKERWEDYYKMYSFAIKETKDAYMPNSQRKQQYINIYEDCTKQNQLLLKYIVQLNKKKEMSDRLARHTDRRSNAQNRNAATASYNSWREAAWTTDNNNQGTDGSIEIPE